ncbi:tRNA(Met) cytidine acetyltransferase TmcA [Zhongshania aliphaticivorans]|uniref:tRNA(Met) cytidine acetyltransferase TmcA n=1 Tax=Zhongshania aliphaticivorans TaxID=1470434 RepID=A0A5S9NH81_9GAMM|nr:GNAT family N-acetyltransferase [Zhongshania aliphaticivorans]CAA0089755.1 tRNA(Met) cytidine acetyltransferase TmcA [Zhongshania aliphaticivorans]CAA0096726.1 tRNA(Met) cytidine acetyltransferase TmcA [Zhongshania aliphaticivorans]
MSSAGSLGDFLQKLREVGEHNGHRYLLFLSGSQSWANEQIARLALQDSESLLVSEDSIGCVNPKNAKRQLGKEFRSVIINAYTSQSVDDYLAAAGTLMAGGVLIVICPEFSQWPGYFQSNSEHIKDNKESFFIQRLLSKVPMAEGVYHLNENSFLSQLPQLRLPNKQACWQTILPNQDQQAAVSAIVKVVKGRSWRPLVIRSDRGRGKSSSLGIAVAKLFEMGACSRVAITAPGIDSVHAAFRHVQRLLPQGKSVDNCFTYHHAILKFLPACELAASGEWDLVLVDEAAALPVTLLHRLLRRYPRLVFSTTVHGYEGSGRGFDIRFKDILQKERPQWRRCELRIPVRWSNTDPLEAWLNSAFLLNAEPIAEPAGEDVQVRILEPDCLKDEDILSQVFGLLVQAHYQTSPRDLQYLVDLSCVVIVAESRGIIVGVCQLLPEGELALELAKAVACGKRRPLGHLVAQRLTHLSGNTRYARLPSYRVNRIAVAAAFRRRGVGGRLLDFATTYAQQQKAAFLSSSFAATADVVSFWQKSGFTSLWLGSRRDSSSGAYSLIVGKGIGCELETGFTNLHAQFRVDIPLTVRNVHSHLDAETLMALLEGDYSGDGLSERDLNNVRRYCVQELIFEQAVASLIRICVHINFRSSVGAELAFELLLFGHDWSSIASQYKLAGRAEVEQQLRCVINQALIKYDELEEI